MRMGTSSGGKSRVGGRDDVRRELGCVVLKPLTDLRRLCLSVIPCSFTVSIRLDFVGDEDLSEVVTCDECGEFSLELSLRRERSWQSSLDFSLALALRLVWGTAWPSESHSSTQAGRGFFES